MPHIPTSPLSKRRNVFSKILVTNIQRKEEKSTNNSKIAYFRKISSPAESFWSFNGAVVFVNGILSEIISNIILR